LFGNQILQAAADFRDAELFRFGPSPTHVRFTSSADLQSTPLHCNLPFSIPHSTTTLRFLTHRCLDEARIAANQCHCGTASKWIWDQIHLKRNRFMKLPCTKSFICIFISS
jgi:hypothetical protein